jgi:hypothetical protein
MLFCPSRVKQTTTSEGLGNITLGAPVFGYSSIADWMPAAGDTFSYMIDYESAGEWEHGIGAVVTVSPFVFERQQVLDSSLNHGDPVDFSVGEKTFYVPLSTRGSDFAERCGVVNTITPIMRRFDPAGFVLAANTWVNAPYTNVIMDGISTWDPVASTFTLADTTRGAVYVTARIGVEFSAAYGGRRDVMLLKNGALLYPPTVWSALDVTSESTVKAQLVSRPFYMAPGEAYSVRVHHNCEASGGLTLLHSDYSYLIVDPTY